MVGGSGGHWWGGRGVIGGGVRVWLGSAAAWLVTALFSDRRFLGVICLPVLSPTRFRHAFLIVGFHPGECYKTSSKVPPTSLQITTSICDLVCSRCCLRRASRRPSDRRFLPGETRNSVIKSNVKIEGLGNRRVIDFLKHSSNIGLRGLDLEAPSAGHFGARNAPNHVNYKLLVFVHFSAPPPASTNQRVVR